MYDKKLYERIKPRCSYPVMLHALLIYNCEERRTRIREASNSKVINCFQIWLIGQFGVISVVFTVICNEIAQVLAFSGALPVFWPAGRDRSSIRSKSCPHFQGSIAVLYPSAVLAHVCLNWVCPRVTISAYLHLDNGRCQSSQMQYANTIQSVNTRFMRCGQIERTEKTAPGI
jgi:hypothetical protein